MTNIVMATVTAYCAGKCCCGPNAKGITANGQYPTEQRTIAASRSIPFGSKVIFAGREYIVQDRLTKRYDSRFDIYFTKHSDAKKFGIKTNQTIKIITINLQPRPRQNLASLWSNGITNYESRHNSHSFSHPVYLTNPSLWLDCMGDCS